MADKLLTAFHAAVESHVALKLSSQLLIDPEHLPGKGEEGYKEMMFEADLEARCRD